MGARSDRKSICNGVRPGKERGEDSSTMQKDSQSYLDIHFLQMILIDMNNFNNELEIHPHWDRPAPEGGGAAAGGPSRTRTCDPVLRRHVLYPPELWDPRPILPSFVPGPTQSAGPGALTPPSL